MLSAEDLAAIKIAVELCNGPELKGEMLRIEVMDSDNNILSDGKERWDDNMENKCSILLENLGLGNYLHEKVIGFVLLIGMRMLTWAKYHESFLGLNYEFYYFAIDFLKSYFFTSRGIIDNKKVAEKLIVCESLNITQRYKLACLYCFVNKIPILFMQMSKKDQNMFYDARSPKYIKQPRLTMFWSYFVMEEIDQLTAERNVNEYLTVIAIMSGSKAAVEYCLERTDFSKKERALIDAAVKTVENIVSRKGFNYFGELTFTCHWPMLGHCIKPWVPNSYYIELLCFLFDKMTVVQQVEFLSKDIQLEYSMICLVLRYFLEWPYQDYFMRAATLMWEFLPKRSFIYLLEVICQKIEFETKNGTLHYGDGKSYSYRKLLNKFWCKSLQCHKKYLFSPTSKKKFFGLGQDIIVSIFLLNNFTNEDWRNIEVILESATDEEKRDIIFSKSAENMCTKLMREEKWGRVNMFFSSCCSSLVSEIECKGNVCFTEEAQCICIELVKNEKWDAIESFMRWSSLSEEKIIQLKREMVNSDEGMSVCSDLISRNGVKSANTFCAWFISSEEDFKEFKEKFIHSHFGWQICHKFFSGLKFEMVDEFIRWCISTPDIGDFKKRFAYEHGSDICSCLIAPVGCSKEWVEPKEPYTLEPLWEQVEMFLTFCFSSEKEITVFKRNIFLKCNGFEIMAYLICLDKWIQAETFLAWLELPFDEIKKLKKEVLYLNMSDINFKLKFNEDDGDKWEKIKLLLRWCLTDPETIREFKKKFDCKYGFKTYENISGDMIIKLHKFYSFIDELLDEYSQKAKREFRSMAEDLSTVKKIRTT